MQPSVAPRCARAPKVLLLLGLAFLFVLAAEARAGATLAAADIGSDVIGIEETMQSAEDESFDVASALHRRARKQGKCVHKKQLVDCSTPGSYDPGR